MSDPNASPLEELLDKASEGEQAATELFFKELLKSTLFVPDRKQSLPLKNQPQYPNELTYILGVEDKDRTIIPCFTRKELIKEWCGQELVLRDLSALKLLSLIPEGWWLILNPGMECSKEFSPWEIALLKKGEENIPEVIQELEDLNYISAIELSPLISSDYLELRTKLIDLAKENSKIKRLFLLKEKGVDANQKEVNSLILGIEADTKNVKELEAIKENFRVAVDILLIGAEAMKIRAGFSVEDNLLLGIFKGIEPIYNTPKKSVTSRILSSLFKTK